MATPADFLNWTIIVPENPTPVEKKAGEELQKYIELVTGQKLDILNFGGTVSEKSLKINIETLPENEIKELGDEGVYYAITDDGVSFIGSPKRGVLYSVYSFLEDEMDVHYYTEDFISCKENKNLQLENKTVKFIPPMHYRAASFSDGTEGKYCAFNKMNARSAIPEEYGGSIEFGIGFVHTLHGLVPDSLFDTHPEYFPEINGERQKGWPHQRCLTNPDVIAMTIEKVRADFRAHPDHKIASVSQADTGEDPFCCTCPECRRINEEEGSLMGTHLRYVNAVADAIKDEFPDRFIETLAYRFTRHVPKITKPRDNVIIRLCSIECCFSHPLDECLHSNPAFVKDMCDWSEVAKHIYIWDYVTNFTHYLAPHPNIPVLGPNMKFFVNHNTVGMFPEGAPDVRGSELSELKSWLLAKLMWNPDFDVKKGTEDFINAYLGKSAVYILDYINMLNGRADITGTHFNCYKYPDREFFSEEFMTRAEDDFAKALEAAETDEIRYRLEHMRMCLRYIRLVVYPDAKPVEELREDIKIFVEDLKKYGITGIREGGVGADNFAELTGKIRNVIPDFSM